MADVILECKVTEYVVIPKLEYEKVAFCLNDRSLVISICDENDNVLESVEISKEDARLLSKIINCL